MIKNLCLTVTAVLMLTGVCFAQTDTAGTRHDAQLKYLLKNSIAENIYLHFDKPYYAAGDTIYFKAYATMGDGHLPSKLSGILYVDLINTLNNTNQSLKLQLVNGIAWGNISLADSLPKGNYHIRAYTRWMRNNGQENFFDRLIPVGSVKDKSETVAAQANQDRPDVQFFPEGGHLLAGIDNKIAFKAIGSNGLGLKITGDVTDEGGVSVAHFSSEHLGMGYFMLKPQPGKTYAAKVIFAGGQASGLALPPVVASGMVLTADNDSLAKISVKIVANTGYFSQNQHKPYTVKITSGGKQISFKGKLDYEVMRFDVRKKTLRTGVTRITLYDGDGQPVSERLVFVQSPDLLNITAKTKAKEYASRSRVNVDISAKNMADVPAEGSFSVSVTDESKVPVDENNEHTILTDMLLTSEVRGYVEQPNYYFTSTDPDMMKKLDLLMLSQGYRTYVWKPKTDSVITYYPEQFLQIAGKLFNLSGKRPEVNGKVSLMSQDGGPVLTKVSGSDGGFAFSDVVYYGYTRFLLNGENARGNKNVKVILDKDSRITLPYTPPGGVPDPAADVNALMPAYLDNDKQVKVDMIKYGPLRGKMLNEVKINGIKRATYRTNSFAGAGNADQVIHMKDVKEGGPLSSILYGRLRGIYFVKGVPVTQGGAPMLVVVDGLELPSHLPSNPNVLVGESSIDHINAIDVETVEVLKGVNALIYGGAGGAGVLIITTKQGTGLTDEDIAQRGVFPIVLKGFFKAREFYAPKYDLVTPQRGGADRRSTIFWKPDIVTDTDGNASIAFYNADGPATYRVVVEGIDAKGTIGRQVYRYTVK